MVLPVPSALASDEKVIGKWHADVGIFKRTIKIVKEGEKFFIINTFERMEPPETGQLKRQLTEIKAKSNEKRRFKELNNSHGEWYAIDANGNLDLYDKEGYIREAKKADSPLSTSEQISRYENSQESCYKLGVRYGRCAFLALLGRNCDPADDFIKPKRCMGNSNFDIGIRDGEKQVLKRYR